MTDVPTPPVEPTRDVPAPSTLDTAVELSPRRKGGASEVVAHIHHLDVGVNAATDVVDSSSMSSASTVGLDHPLSTPGAAPVGAIVVGMPKRPTFLELNWLACVGET